MLAPAYPNVKSQTGDWEECGGFIDYRLDERHTLSVSSIFRGGQKAVDEPTLFCVYDLPSKRRLELKDWNWEKQPDKKAKDK